MSFTSTQMVRFSHIDAAGIVYYPRYFEMMTAAIEEFFDKCVGIDFNTLHLVRKLSIPTVSLESKFLSPSRLGDSLEFQLTVLRTGRSSADIGVEVICKEETRLRAQVVLVCMDLTTNRSVAWPDDIRLQNG